MEIPRGRRVLLTDALAIAWVILAILLGIATAETIKALTAISSGITTVGGAISESGRTLGDFELPILGGNPGEGTGNSIERAGEDVRQQGEDIREEIVSTANGLGLIIGIVAALPVLMLYGPGRIARWRDSSALRRDVGRYSGDPRFERFLAQRAAQAMPYRRLRQISEEPWREAEVGPFRPLAAEELRRLGISPRRLDQRGSSVYEPEDAGAGRPSGGPGAPSRRG